MPFFLLAALLLFAGFFARHFNPQLERFSTIFKIAGGLVLFIGVSALSIRQIGAGTVGVKTLFGQVQPDVLNSGLHAINPLVEVSLFDTRTQNYTMSGAPDEGAKIGDDAIRVLSADGLEVSIDLTVLYHVIAEESPRLLRETGLDYIDKIVRPISRTKIRDNAVYYNAVDLYSNKRAEFQSRIFQNIEKDFKDRGLFLEQLLIRNITLPVPVKVSIEQKITAEQDAQKMEFVLQKEKQEAERKRIEAQGISDYQKTINSSLTDQQLQYESIKTMQELVKSDNAKVIVLGKDNAPVLISSDK